MTGGIVFSPAGGYSMSIVYPSAVLAGHGTGVMFMGALNTADDINRINDNASRSSHGGSGGGNPEIPKGFKETKEFGYQHGQKVYKYKNKYYSKDVDGHNGGIWKVFEVYINNLMYVTSHEDYFFYFSIVPDTRFLPTFAERKDGRRCKEEFFGLSD
jgi:hypothetical protein